MTLERDGAPFGSIRVGISTVFLKRELAPILNRAMIMSGVAILLSLMLAAGLSNVALKPLELIGRRLDLMTGARSIAASQRNAKANPLTRWARSIRKSIAWAGKFET